MVSISVSLISLFDWPHESNKFTGNDRVKITVFYFFIILILFDVESFEVVPSKPLCVFQTLKAMQKSTVVIAITF